MRPNSVHLHCVFGNASAGERRRRTLKGNRICAQLSAISSIKTSLVELAEFVFAFSFFAFDRRFVFRTRWVTTQSRFIKNRELESYRTRYRRVPPRPREKSVRFHPLARPLSGAAVRKNVEGRDRKHSVPVPLRWRSEAPFQAQNRTEQKCTALGGAFFFFTLNPLGRKNTERFSTRENANPYKSFGCALYTSRIYLETRLRAVQIRSLIMKTRRGPERTFTTPKIFGCSHIMRFRISWPLKNHRFYALSNGPVPVL